MRSFTILGLATLGALALSPAAFAQDSGDTASGKRFTVVGGIAQILPKSDPSAGIRKLDGGPAPTLSLGYNFTDNISAELWGAVDKFDNKVQASNGGGKQGTVSQQPVALSAQYHFGAADNIFRPFVGLGYYQSRFSDIQADGVADPTSLPSHIDKAKGAIGTLGVDVNINSTWFARADARYMRGRPDANFNGTTQELKLDPWTVGVGIGARF